MAAVAALLMVAIAVGAFFVLRGNSKSKPTAAPIPSLMTSGTVHLASGKTATLQWSEVPKATKYGLQIATSQLDPKDSVVFAHPLKTLTTSKTYYFMKVVGKQFYYWRVRARVSGKWGSFARSQHFLVSKPKVGIPAPRSPRNGAALRVKRVQLCWSPVQGAFEYSLRLNGSNMVVRSTCSSLRVKPQLYRWSVAARVKAALVYAGLRSPSFAFTVLKPRVKARPKPTPAPTSAPAPAPTTAPAPAPTVAPAPAPTTAPAPAPTYAPAPAPTTPPAPAPTTPPAPAPTTPSGPHCNPC
jgi:hypothetical protein